MIYYIGDRGQNFAKTSFSVTPLQSDPFTLACIAAFSPVALYSL